MFRSLCNPKDGKAPLLLNSHSDFEHPEISFRVYTFISQIRPSPVCEELSNMATKILSHIKLKPKVKDRLI